MKRCPIRHVLSSICENTILGSSIKGIEKPFEISPEMFLDFAEADLQSALSHRFVNALSNIRRALDSQVASILHTLGIGTLGLDFPQKIDILDRVGLISPKILLRINHSRNLLEHEFVNPSPENVLRALDTVSVFIAYTDARLLKFRDEIIFIGAAVRSVKVFDGFVEIWLDGNKGKESITIREPEQCYFEVLKWMIQVSNEWW